MSSEFNAASAEPVLVDHLIDTVTQMLAQLRPSSFTNVTTQVSRESAAFLTAVMATAQSCEPTDPSSNASNLAAATAQRAFDKDKATASLELAMLAASGAVKEATVNWQSAVAKYQFAAAEALVTLNAAIVAAEAAYKVKIDKDSASRSANRYYELKTAAATAFQTYQVAVAAVAGQLAADAGSFISIYTTSISAAEMARAQYQLTIATADQTFWQSAAGVIDEV